VYSNHNANWQEATQNELFSVFRMIFHAVSNDFHPIILASYNPLIPESDKAKPRPKQHNPLVGLRCDIHIGWY